MQKFSREALERALTHDQWIFVSDHLLSQYFRGIQAELMSIAHEAGKDITLLVCKMDLAWCLSNPNHRRLDCMRCLSNVSQLTSRFGERLRVEFLSDANQTSAKFPLGGMATVDACESVSELETVSIDGINLGPGIASGLSITLQDRPANLRRHADLIRSITMASWMSYVSLRTTLTGRANACMILANGRTPTSWAAHLAAQDASVQFMTYEWVPANRGARLEYGRLVHSYEGIQERMTYYSDLCSKSERFRQAAEEFFISNRFDKSDGISGLTNITTSRNVFLRGQQRDCLPEQYSDLERNIAVFTSSEWEFAGLPGWQNPLGISQASILQRLLLEGSFDERVRFWLRIHPGLTGSRSQELKSLRDINHPRLRVIGPESTVDSYALMDASEKVISFGSTIGIEAVYWGKPSILCGRAMYESLEACERPTSIEELVSLLNRPLNTPNRALAVPFGLLAREEGLDLTRVVFGPDFVPKQSGQLLVENQVLRICTRIRKRGIDAYRWCGRLFRWIQKRARRLGWER